MREKELRDIDVDRGLECFICHQSGEILHKPGETISLKNLALLEECGITKVTLLDANEDPQKFKNELMKKKVPLQSIRSDEICPLTLLNESNTTVIKSGEIIRKEILDDLLKKGTEFLYYEKDAQELQSFAYKRYQALLESELFESIGDIQFLEHPKERLKREVENRKRLKEIEKSAEVTDIKNIRIDSALLCANPGKEISENILKHEIMKNTELLRRPAGGPAVRDLLRPVSPQRPPDHTKMYIQRYKQWVKQLQDMYSSIKANQAVPCETVQALIAEMIIAYLEDSALFLSLINCRMASSSDKYVASHCVNVCILATGMSATMGYSAPHTVEIAWGALFHDIGHTSTFRPLLGKEKLDADEQHQFDQHVITGLSLLKNIISLPRSVAYVAYQHHERINGSGTILRCQGSSIHDFAKLVGVADEFESIAAKKSPFSGMSAIIAQTRTGIFDPAIVKALLLTLSLYPLGSLVLVTNNRVGRVISVNGEHFKEPIINIFCELNQNQLFELPQNEIVDLLKRTDIKIIKDITHPMLSAKIEKGF